MRKLSEVEARLVQRIDNLIAKAPTTGMVMSGPFAEWKAQSLNLLRGNLGAEHVYSESFQSETTVADAIEVRAGVGVLRALREDLIEGNLTDLRTLISAEVFGDFLDMAQHLLENHYKDAAAAVCGAVLEDGLRRIAAKASVPVKRGDDLGSLSQKLMAKGTYSSLVQKRLQVWIAVRNSADHAKWAEYSEQDVLDMHKGVTDFLAEQLR
jgi:hypothetical protein